MTLQSFDRRTHTLRRAVWGLNPLEKALVLVGGAVGAFGTYLVVVIVFGLSWA